MNQAIWRWPVMWGPGGSLQSRWWGGDLRLAGARTCIFIKPRRPGAQPTGFPLLPATLPLNPYLHVESLILVLIPLFVNQNRQICAIGKT